MVSTRRRTRSVERKSPVDDSVDDVVTDDLSNDKDKIEGDGVVDQVVKSGKKKEPTPGNIQEDGFVAAFYEPRTVTGLFMLVLAIVYVGVVNEEAMLGENREKSGLLTMASAFLLYCMIQLRDGDLLRPHPAIWRVVHGAGLLYFMLLVYLLCQEMTGVQAFLQLFDENIGKPEPEQDYAEDCRIYIYGSDDPWQNFKHKFYDRFVVAHFVGWFLKALIIRDWLLMWVASIVFEVLEVSMQHLLPNFAECYWDKIVLDLFGCNLLGMIFGMYAVDLFATNIFNWTGQELTAIPGTVGKVKRVALQFAPYRFETYKWEIFSSWRHLMIGVAVVVVLLVGEINAFWIKSVLHIPIASNVNLYRLALWTPLTYMAVYDFHVYADGKRRRIGVNAWLASSLVALETLLVAKHGYQTGLFTRDQLRPDDYIVGGWMATFVLIGLAGLTLMLRTVLVWCAGGTEVPHNDKAKKKKSEDHGDNVPRLFRALYMLDELQGLLTFAIPVPFILILLVDSWNSYHIVPKLGE